MRAVNTWFEWQTTWDEKKKKLLNYGDASVCIEAYKTVLFLSLYLILIIKIVEFLAWLNEIKLMRLLLWSMFFWD